MIGEFQFGRTNPNGKIKDLFCGKSWIFGFAWENAGLGRKLAATVDESEVWLSDVMIAALWERGEAAHVSCHAGSQATIQLKPAWWATLSAMYYVFILIVIWQKWHSRPAGRSGPALTGWTRSAAVRTVVEMNQIRQKWINTTHPHASHLSAKLTKNKFLWRLKNLAA